MSYDEAYVLQHAVGWGVGSQTARENGDRLSVLEAQGYIRRRDHWFPGPKEWGEFYALTGPGFARLKEIATGSQYEDARTAHEFYEENERVGLAEGL